MPAQRRTMNVPGRSRPLLTFTTSPDVKAALQAKATEVGAPLSHVVEDLLRVALGLPPVAGAPTVAA